MSKCFPKLTHLGGNVKVELDLFNYATKPDLEHAASVNTWKFAKKVDLTSLKSDFDELDIDKRKTIPSGLSNLNSTIGKFLMVIKRIQLME